MIELGCMAHARRKLFDLNAVQANPHCRRRRDGQSAALQNARQTIQRLMIGVIGNHHLCQHAGHGQSLVDDLCRHRCLSQGLALSAGPLAAHMAIDDHDHRGVIEFLGDIFTNALELATATAAGRRFRFVMDIGAWQVRRNRRALGLALPGFLCCRARARQFFLDGGNVGGTGFVEQMDLLGRETFCLGTKLPTTVQGQFGGELVDLALAPGQFRDLADNDRFALASPNVSPRG